jgi:hypothetical protein
MLAPTHSRTVSGPFLLIVCVGLLAALAWYFVVLPGLQTNSSIVVASEHALVRHGALAISAENCFNGGGTIRVMRRRPSDNRLMKGCEMNGFWFIGIFSPDGTNDTMYPKDGRWNASHIWDYASRAGFTSRP